MIGEVWIEEESEDLVERLWNYSPVVEKVAKDRALVDFGKRVPKLGFQALVGVGTNRFVAHLASFEGVRVKGGEEEAFVAPFSIRCLPIEDETMRKLRVLGFQRLEDLRGLSIEDLVLQFGEEGEVIWERCRGIDETPLSPEPLPDLLEAVCPREEVGGPWLDELFGRLRDRGELCVQMVVEGLEINFSRPTCDPKAATQLFLARAGGEEWGGIESVRVVVSKSVKACSEQMSLFRGERERVVRAMRAKGSEALMQVVWDERECRLPDRRAHLESLLEKGKERPLCVPRKFRGEVVKVIERWEVEEDWWKKEPVERAYATVILRDGSHRRLFCDRRNGGLFSH